MPIHSKADVDTRYLTAFSQKGLNGCLVRIPYYPSHTRDSRTWHSKLFAYRDFQSKEAAIQAAIAYRDQWFSDHPDELKLRPTGARFSLKLPSNNTSGIIGVTRSSRIGKSGTPQSHWQTTFRGTEGKPVNKKFLVSKFGELGALRRAIEARRDGLLDLIANLDDQIVDANIDAIAFYDDILSNLHGCSDFDKSSPLVEIVKQPDIVATTKLEQILVRIGQQTFRREVMQQFNNCCAVTGSSILIRASHIKPWRIATDEERLDPANGLALSPVYDAAFDLGLVSFAADGRIMISLRLNEDAERLGITGAEKLRFMTEAHQPYLDWHRKNLFIGLDG